MTSIVIIEDDRELGELISRVLEKHGYHTTLFNTAEQFRQHSPGTETALVICDIMLPDGDGFELAAEIKAHYSCPFLFLTALDSEESHIRGLNLGATDYLIKPIKPELLLARVAANIRKVNILANPDIKQLGYLKLDAARCEAWYGKTNLNLNRQEFILLEHLMRYDPEPVSRDMLFKAVVGRDYDGIDRAIDLKVSRLRKKFSEAGVPIDIKSIRAQGYALTTTDL
ncbi:Sensory transduction protein regX3 [Saliniradius amylolyticus]|uniref:Sensory transduction protein regX3 n=1 Tax=Saliniradius amylolyticus TaxID=2183582 RepID=A0A2S2E1T1_9ALTE|nr:response regulator transcription factor [Saliniradius amylolyticus]AWL11549.1 Sensory transduction protein regX3 [Saliniradius amylolyticus]